MKSNYKYDDTVVKWGYIVDFYKIDKTMSIRMAPELTDRHIMLPPFTVVRGILTAQILSHSMAAGINTLFALKYLSDEASATAKFVEMFVSCLMLSVVLVLQCSQVQKCFQ